MDHEKAMYVQGATPALLPVCMLQLLHTLSNLVLLKLSLNRTVQRVIVLLQAIPTYWTLVTNHTCSKQNLPA